MRFMTMVQLPRMVDCYRVIRYSRYLTTYLWSAAKSLFLIVFVTVI